jgi:hypothetical protein
VISDSKANKPGTYGQEVDSTALRYLLLHGLHVALGMEALLIPLQLELHALPHLGSARCTQIAL